MQTLADANKVRQIKIFNTHIANYIWKKDW